MQASFQVVSMHAFSPAVSKFLFDAAAGKLQPGLVKESAALIYVGHPDENGGSICHDPEPRLAFAQLVLSGCTLFDHGRQKQERNCQTNQKYFNCKSALFSCFRCKWAMSM